MTSARSASSAGSSGTTSSSGHKLISFAAVKELPEFKRERDWIKSSAQDGKGGQYGRPIAALFTTERFLIKQGLLDGDVNLDAGIYTFEFKGKGLPFELQKAMLAGAKVLKLNKGKRPNEEEMKALAEKAAKKDKKKKKKRGKKDDCGGHSRSAALGRRSSTPSVSRTTTPGSIPKVTIKKLTIHPGRHHDSRPTRT